MDGRSRFQPSLSLDEQLERELERRRIIVNQVVRRKTIDTWVCSKVRQETVLDEVYDDTLAPATKGPPLPPRNPGWFRSAGRSWAVWSSESSGEPASWTSSEPRDNGLSAR